GLRVRTLKVRRPSGELITVVEDGRVPTPSARVDFVTLGFLAKGGDGWFPGRVKGLDAKPLVREGGDVTEQWSLRAFVEELDRAGAWERGEAWPDPVPGRPETCTRIREIDVEVGASAPDPRCGG